MEPAEEYFIEFFTESGGAKPHTIDGIRIRIDMVNITDMNAKFRVDLCDHPLYPNLKKYVKKNG